MQPRLEPDIVGQSRSCRQESSPVAAFPNRSRHGVVRQVARGGVAASKNEKRALSGQKKQLSNIQNEILHEK